MNTGMYSFMQHIILFIIYVRTLGIQNYTQMISRKLDQVMQI